jgi:hypothetical protein
VESSGHLVKSGKYLVESSSHQANYTRKPSKITLKILLQQLVNLINDINRHFLSFLLKAVTHSNLIIINSLEINSYLLIFSDILRFQLALIKVFIPNRQKMSAHVTSNVIATNIVSSDQLHEECHYQW